MPKGVYNRKLDSNDVDIVGAVHTTSIEDTAAGKDLSPTLDLDKVYSTDALDRTQFMNQELDVLFHEPTSENEPSFVEVNVNGDYRMAIRGNSTKLKRYHVEVLARAKQSRVRQRKIVNGDGSMGFVEEQVLSLTYPFVVEMDPAGAKGRDWLKQLLANPA